ASSGAIESPRRFRSRRSSFQDCALSEEGRPKAPVASNLTLTITMSRDAAFPWKEAPRYLIRDRDAIYGAAVTRRLRAMGIRDKPIAPSSPWQNSFAESDPSRMRRPCNRIRRAAFAPSPKILCELLQHRENTGSLDNDAPVSRPVQRIGRIVSHALVGGLHHQYARL